MKGAKTRILETTYFHNLKMSHDISVLKIISLTAVFANFRLFVCGGV